MKSDQGDSHNLAVARRRIDGRVGQRQEASSDVQIARDLILYMREQGGPFAAWRIGVPEGPWPPPAAGRDTSTSTDTCICRKAFSAGAAHSLASVLVEMLGVEAALVDSKSMEDAEWIYAFPLPALAPTTTGDCQP